MLKLPMVISSGMVLQRGKPVRLWGEADPGAAVEVRLERGGGEVSRAVAAAGPGGEWELTLPPVEAGEGYSLLVSSGTEELRLTDILFGEVWVAGGQSNMEYRLAFDARRDEVFADEPDPALRFFDYPEVSYEGELEDADYSEFGRWRQYRREDAPWWSAVPCWFGRVLRRELGVPVGVVGVNWGGTSASCWMDERYISGAGQVWLREYEEANRDVDPEEYARLYRENPLNHHAHPLEGDTRVLWPGLTREEQLRDMELAAMLPQDKYAGVVGPVHPNRPGGLYRTMLRKVAPYAARGIIWYQGESDDAHPALYGGMLRGLIRNWRDLWGEELPFLMTQLAPFRGWFQCTGEAYPILRERQDRVAGEVPGVYLASTSDCGMEWDIHPKDKKPVGERLALLALGHVYGRDILCEAPRYSRSEVRDGCLAVYLDHAEGLHTQGGGEISALTVNGAPAKGRIQGGTLVVPLPAELPADVALAGTDYYTVNLKNAAGLPAKPFRVTVE